MKRIDNYYPKSTFSKHYPDLEQAAAGLETACSTLCGLLAMLPESELYGPVAPGKWSPAEVGDHLVLVNINLRRTVRHVMRGLPFPVMPKGYLSDEGNPVSPAIGKPRPGRSFDELQVDLQRSSADLIETVKSAGERGRSGETCLVHAFFGEMTVLECLQLAAWHIDHHLRGLERD